MLMWMVKITDKNEIITLAQTTIGNLVPELDEVEKVGKYSIRASDREPVGCFCRSRFLNKKTL